MNKVYLMGRLGTDIKSGQTQNGNYYANFSIATSEKWKDKNTGEMQEKTEWHNISAFGNQAKAIKEYCSKGDQIMVEGKVTTRKYNDKDGIERYSTSVQLQSFEFGAKKKVKNQEQQAQPQMNNTMYSSSNNFDADQIPF